MVEYQQALIQALPRSEGYTVIPPEWNLTDKKVSSLVTWSDSVLLKQSQQGRKNLS